MASLKNVDLIMTEGHRDAQGTAHGGVLIMIDKSKMTLKKVKHEHPNLICVEAEMGDSRHIKPHAGGADANDETHTAKI